MELMDLGRYWLLYHDGIMIHSFGNGVSSVLPTNELIDQRVDNLSHVFCYKSKDFPYVQKSDKQRVVCSYNHLPILG
jgi:hypothetical protein